MPTFNLAVRIAVFALIVATVSPESVSDHPEPHAPEPVAPIFTISQAIATATVSATATAVYVIT